MRRSLPALALLIGVSACKKTPAEAEAEAKKDDEAQVVALCDRMNDLSLAYVAGLADLDVDSLKDPGVRDQAKAACKQMPLKVVECANRFALDDPACDAALEKYMGMTDSTPQGQGPAPRWQLAVPFEIYDLEVSGSGAIAIAGEKSVGLVVDGAVKWTTELEKASSRVGWWKDHVLTGAGAELRAHDGEGTVVWTARIDEDDGIWLSAIEPGPSGKVVVVTSKGAIVHVDGDRCAAGPEGCTTTLGTVESMGGMSVKVLSSGAILGSSDTRVALVSASGGLLSRRSVDYDAGMPGDGLIVVGKDVLRANPSCQPNADDCLSVVASHEDMELVAPVEVPGVGLAHSDTYGVILMTGDTTWQVDAGNDGDLLTDGTLIYSVGHQLGLGSALEAPPQLRAIDAKTGKTRWITTLGTERAGLLSGYITVLHGDELVISSKKNLFLVPLGKEPS